MMTEGGGGKRKMRARTRRMREMREVLEVAA